MKIIITGHKSLERNVMLELNQHIKSLCHLLADDMLMVSFEDDYTAFGAKK